MPEERSGEEEHDAHVSNQRDPDQNGRRIVLLSNVGGSAGGIHRAIPSGSHSAVGTGQSRGLNEL